MNNNFTQTSTPGTNPQVSIVYDGECPFCQQYTHLLRLRASAGEVKLVDARSGDPLVQEVIQRGFDLDEGMIVTIADRFYHGADAMRVLALLSTRSGWFNRLNYFVFRSRSLAAFLYPLLRTCRNLALRVLRRKAINNGNP